MPGNSDPRAFKPSGSADYVPLLTGISPMRSWPSKPSIAAGGKFIVPFRAARGGEPG
jgi:hypothetical protein